MLSIPQENQPFFLNLGRIDPGKVYPVNTTAQATPTKRAVLSTSVSRIVSPEEAATWLEKNQYIYQRELSKKLVREYRESMEQGIWPPATQIEFAVNLQTGKTVLINGQHRLQAQVQSKTSQEYSILRINYTTDEELAFLYATRDSGWNRTPVHAMRAYGLQHDMGLLTWQLSTAIASVKMINNGFVQASSRKRNNPEMAKAILRYKTGIDKYYENAIPKEGYFTIVRRAPVAALCIVLYQYASHVYGEEMVDNFIKGSIFGISVNEIDPRKVAFDHLISTKLRSKMVDNGGRKGGSVTAEYQVRYLIHCWNAYSEGRPIKTTRVVGELNAPVTINGTPWKGKEIRV